MSQDFLSVRCQECGNEQNVFSHASNEVECLVCGEIIAKPQGGKAEITGEVVAELETE